MTKVIQVTDEVYEALLDRKTRNVTFDGVIREMLYIIGDEVSETKDGNRV